MNCICTGWLRPVVTVRTSSFGSTTVGAVCAAAVPANTNAPATDRRPYHCSHPNLPLCSETPHQPPTHSAPDWFDATLTAMLERRTKIVATLGPATDADGVLDRLVAAGLDCARLNCSHGSHEDLRRRAAEVRAASARAGRPIGAAVRPAGPEAAPERGDRAARGRRRRRR